MANVALGIWFVMAVLLPWLPYLLKKALYNV